MPRDNAPINITRPAETFIYLYSSPEIRGRGQAEFYLWSIKLINNGLSTLLACWTRRVEKLIRSLTDRIRNSTIRAPLLPRDDREI